MSRSARVGQAVLVLFGVLCTVIALSVFFVPDPFEPDAQALIGTFGAGMGLLVLVLATAGLASGQRWPWLALWLLPVFFLSHVALIGTLLPDGVFTVIAVAALLATRPDAPTRRSTRVPMSRVGV